MTAFFYRPIKCIERYWITSDDQFKCNLERSLDGAVFANKHRQVVNGPVFQLYITLQSLSDRTSKSCVETYFDESIKRRSCSTLALPFPRIRLIAKLAQGVCKIDLTKQVG